MAVDRSMRAVVVSDLAALMRGEIGPSQFTSDTQALCDQPAPANDFLVESFWSNRLGPLPSDLPRLRRLEVSVHEYERLERWLAILQTDVDWNVERELPKSRHWIEACPVVLTIGTMIAAGVLLDGVLIIAWVLIGLVVGPVATIVLLRQSNEPAGNCDTDPFATIEDRDSVIHLVREAGAPPYDPLRHGVSLATKMSRFLSRFPILILAGASMCALWPLAIWIAWKGNEDRIERVPLYQEQGELISPQDG